MSLRSLALIPWVVGLVSAALLAYGAYTAWDESRAPTVRVKVPHVTLDHAQVGANTVEYVVINEGRQPVRFLGGDARCVETCCIHPVFRGSETIPPGGQLTVPYEIFVPRADEPFAAEATLFVLWRDQMVPLDVSVSGTAPGAPSSGPEVAGTLPR